MRAQRANASAASISERSELQRMLRMVRDERPDLVIVHKVDRLARSREDDVMINLGLLQVWLTSLTPDVVGREGCPHAQEVPRGVQA